jgi:hypothetical protein
VGCIFWGITKEKSPRVVKQERVFFLWYYFFFGGPEGIRTPGLLIRSHEKFSPLAILAYPQKTVAAVLEALYHFRLYLKKPSLPLVIHSHLVSNLVSNPKSGGSMGADACFFEWLYPFFAKKYSRV